MTSLTARQCVIHKSGLESLRIIHAKEKRIFRLLTPHEIAVMFSIRPFDADEDFTFRMDRILGGIYDSIRFDMKKSCEQENSPWDEVCLMHWVDNAVKKREIDFHEMEVKKSGSGVLDRVREAKRYAEVSPF
jgi:hypothetical protein